jgi:hypothetical protein
MDNMEYMDLNPCRVLRVTIGQAGPIPGMTQAALTAFMIAMKKRERARLKFPVDISARLQYVRKSRSES